ncbi:MarR family transcriptional regulator, partial [Sodalis-like symbiont of Bactericera trigonica]
SFRALAATIPADILCASLCSVEELGALKLELETLRGHLAQW